MIEFEKYCELYDFIKGKEKLRASFSGIICSTFAIGALAIPAMHCFNGESAIDFMIDQSDIDTLERIRMDFPEGSSQRRHIDRRIFYIKQHGYADDTSQTETVSHELEELEKADTFTYIKSWLNRKKFTKESDFYNKAGISRQLFNRIKNGDISITRDRAFHIALALGLEYSECEEFLKYFGYAFRDWDIKDQIISYILRTSDTYTLDFIDAVLILFKQKTFRSE